MSSICFYFQVHQPLRLRQDYSFFQIGSNHFYEDGEKNRSIIRKVAEKCYLPTNKILLDLIEKHGSKFKITFSFSGIVLEQFEKYAPDVLASFQQLVATGNVEILSETYYHSLAFQFSTEEFRDQVALHKAKVLQLFNVTPTVFRNTELIYNNDLAKEVKKLGYKGILSEGTDSMLMWRSPNFVYRPKGITKFGLLLKNYRLSDDIAFRFSNKNWEHYPLNAEKYAGWLADAAQKGDIVNLFMDYETFGEHQWADTGIFDFLRNLPEQVLRHNNVEFSTPAEIFGKYSAKEELDAPYFVSWADTERDLSAWLGNNMQNSSAKHLYSMEKLVRKAAKPELADVWRKLQASDHLYYMSTKRAGDGDVHNYFNPYNSPYDAFVIYNNVLSDLKLTLDHTIKPVAVADVNQGASAAAAKPKKRRSNTPSPEVTV